MDQPDQSDAAARFPFDAVYKANAHYNMDLPGLEELLAMEDVTVLSSRLDETRHRAPPPQVSISMSWE